MPECSLRGTNFYNQQKKDESQKNYRRNFGGNVHGFAGCMR